MRRLIAFVLLLPACVPATADAHQVANPHLHAVFERIVPAVRGVTVEVRNNPPAPPLVIVRNRSDTPLSVLGVDREPMVEIGPDGVRANRRSPSYYRSQDPTGEASLAADVQPGGDPFWVKVALDPEWRWYERRALVQGSAAPPDARRPVTVGSWRVPARSGTTEVAITGRVVFRPVLGSIRTRLVAPDPIPKGLELKVLPGAIPGIFVRNSTGRTLEIPGRDRRPFARVGPDRAEVNERSITWRDTKGRPPADEAEPSWTSVQESPLLAWLERRAAYEADDPPPEVERSGRPAVLRRWTIRARLGGRPLELSGVTEWIPAHTASRSVVGPAAIAAAAALGAAAVLLVRRRRRARLG